MTALGSGSATDLIAPSSRWIAMPVPRPSATLRLFCFPSAGSGIAPFASWARALPPWIEVCPVRLPGRESRISEVPYRDLNLLAGELAREIGPFLDRPWAFFGHSMGAAIAYELQRRLVVAGHEPALLAVSARRAPAVADRDAPLHLLSDADLVDELRRRYDGIPASILDTPELLELFLPTLRADCELLETHAWEPGPPLPVPVTAFGGTDDRRVSRDDLAAWEAHTTARFRLRMLPGGHFYLYSAGDRFLVALVEELTA